MKPKKRQKMCFNCEGEIDLDVIVCPFCAADLREEKPEQLRGYQPFENSIEKRHTSESLYPPSYPRSESEPSVDEAVVNGSESEEKQAKGAQVVGPTILFTLGVQLFVIGMFILLFSSQGTVILKWSGHTWLFYVLASIPLLYLGYRSLSKLN